MTISGTRQKPPLSPGDFRDRKLNNLELKQEIYVVGVGEQGGMAKVSPGAGREKWERWAAGAPAQGRDLPHLMTVGRSLCCKDLVPTC